MKKFIFFLLAAFCFQFAAQSQVALTVSHTPLTNADTSYLTYRIPATYGAVAMQLVITKTSGTVAGTAIPQGSLDGTNYVDISTDTFTLANQATNTYIWKFDKTYYLYYRIFVKATGTWVGVPTGKLLGRL